MITVDFLPPEFRKEEKKPFSILDLISPKGLLYVLVVLVAAQLALALYEGVFLKPRYARMQNEFMKMKPEINTSRTLKSNITNLQTDNRLLEGWFKRDLLWTRILQATSDNMVRHVWLTELSLSEEMVEKKAVAEPKKPVESESSDDKKKKKSKVPVKKGAVSDHEKRVMLILRGNVSNQVDATSTASQYISNLQRDPTFRKFAEDIYLKDINTVELDDVQLYAFTIYCLVSKDSENSFYHVKSEIE
jgi:hypothetical protein